ncbi:MAG: DUF2306 domain-containing protein [Sphingomicrobium sp.]
MPLPLFVAADRNRPNRKLRWAIITFFALAAALFVADVVRKALTEAFIHDDFPEQLAIKAEQLPLLFPIHMITGALALLLIPLAIAVRRRPRWHRPLARVAAIDVVIAGLTAFPVAWIGPVTRWSAAGFMAQAATWLALLALGLWHIRHGRRAEHRRAMLMMAATASGAIVFRILLALSASFSHPLGFATFYSCDAWLAWLLPLSLTAYGLKREWRVLR